MGEHGFLTHTHTQKKTQMTVIVCHKNEEHELSSLRRVPMVTCVLGSLNLTTFATSGASVPLLTSWFSLNFCLFFFYTKEYILKENCITSSQSCVCVSSSVMSHYL